MVERRLDQAGGTREVIDGEWRMEVPVPVDFVCGGCSTTSCCATGSSSPRRCGTSPSTDWCAARWTPPGSSSRRASSTARFALLERELSAALCPGPFAEGSLAALATVAGLDVAERDLSVIAFADEVAATPGLLAAYAGEFGDEDPLTLLLYAPGADPEEAATSAEAALAAADLGDDAPDMMLLPVPGGAETEAALAADAVAVLSDRRQDGALAALPCFGRAQVDTLRARLSSTPSACRPPPLGRVAEAFDAKLAFVAEALDPHGARVRLLAGWLDGEPVEESPSSTTRAASRARCWPSRRS